MGLQAVPLYIGESGFQNPVENDRNALEFLYQRTGLIRPGYFAVTPTGTARQVSVSAGGAVLLGADTSTQGAYMVWSDAADTYTFAAAVGNPRIDTLVMRAVDKQYGSDPGISRAEIEIVQGVAGSSPTARADSYFNSGGGAYKPGAWYRLADVRINVVDGVLPSGQITQTKQYTRVGGRTVCTSTTRPSDPQVGDEIYETDTGDSLRYVGTGWLIYATGAWKTYTPTVTPLGAGGTFSVGNASLYAPAYKEIGKSVTLTWSIVCGSTTSFGNAGAYLAISLPPGHTATNKHFTGSVSLRDSLVDEYVGSCRIFPNGTTIEMFKAASGRVNNGAPFAPSTNDEVCLQIEYERV